MGTSFLVMGAYILYTGLTILIPNKTDTVSYSSDHFYSGECLKHSMGTFGTITLGREVTWFSYLFSLYSYSLELFSFLSPNLMQIMPGKIIF